MGKIGPLVGVPTVRVGACDRGYAHPEGVGLGPSGLGPTNFAQPRTTALKFKPAVLPWARTKQTCRGRPGGGLEIGD